MTLLHVDDGMKGKFFIEMDGKELACMTYVWAGNDRMMIDHTEVDDQLRGQSAGKKMVLQAVEFARSKGVKIVPLCPFARSVFDKEESLRDVL